MGKVLFPKEQIKKQFMFTTEFQHNNIPNLAPQESSIDPCELPQYRQRTTFVKSHHIYSLQTRLSRVSTSKTFLIH